MESPEHMSDDEFGGDRYADPVAPAPFAEAWSQAVGFFTRWPVGAEGPHPLGACVAAFAPVGAAIGLAVGIADLVARGIGLPALASGLIAIGVGALLTGALHEDGLADTFDALGASDRQQRLSVMRDSRNGTFGTMALIFSVGLRVAALASLPPAVSLFALIGAHAFSRGALALALNGMNAARSDGLGATAGRPSLEQARSAVLLGAAILLVASLFASFAAGLLALAFAAAAGLAMARLAQRAFGGYTGDVMGALQQVMEIAALLAFAVFVGS